ncbi:hypothetical protein EIP91_001345 [Steccherinum ochraceum]|uniref:Uncharacterized protein n=1 Tax=Steccherinum ochraceum TaxID=92696 RepID=A0A4R0RKK2_9APHY|nr:hypothetical protein EIP91_001345 [Steccherinum ochraceum]
MDDLCAGLVILTINSNFPDSPSGRPASRPSIHPTSRLPPVHPSVRPSSIHRSITQD